MKALSVIKLCGIGLLVGWSLVTPMGDTGQTTNTDPQRKMPVFTDLDEGEDKVDAVLYDDGKEFKLTNVNFGGKTTIDGIRSEADESSTTIDLVFTATIELLNKGNYKSTRYPSLNVFAVRKTASNGVTEDFLVPRNVQLSGLDKVTMDKKAWYLDTIDTLVIINPKPTEAAIYVKKKQKGAKPRTVAAASTGIMEKTEYQEKELKIAEKKTAPPRQPGFSNAVHDLITTVFGIIKAIVNFIKNLFW